VSAGTGTKSCDTLLREQQPISRLYFNLLVGSKLSRHSCNNDCCNGHGYQSVPRKRLVYTSFQPFWLGRKESYQGQVCAPRQPSCLNAKSSYTSLLLLIFARRCFLPLLPPPLPIRPGFIKFMHHKIKPKIHNKSMMEAGGKGDVYGCNASAPLPAFRF
jgi:hypothetical protein